jgi:threonyl-tRNA synthetase
MLHRATLGSLERFLGIVLEQHAGRLPAWLAPDQVAVLPVSAAQHGYAQEVTRELERAGLRVLCDVRDESLARRIAVAHEQALPFVAVVGEREHAQRSLSLREGERHRVLPLGAAAATLTQRCAPPL